MSGRSPVGVQFAPGPPRRVSGPVLVELEQMRRLAGDWSPGQAPEERGRSGRGL